MSAKSEARTQARLLLSLYLEKAKEKGGNARGFRSFLKANIGSSYNMEALFDLENVILLPGLCSTLSFAPNTSATGPSTDTATTPAVPSASPEDRAERRQVTVMFSDLVGSTALSARMDPTGFQSRASMNSSNVTPHIFG